MSKTLIWIISLAVALLAIIVSVMIISNKKKINIILTIFRSGNTLVAGHKGTGKDLLFNMVICKREKAGEIHAANIKYTDKTRVAHPKEYCIEDISYEDFITGNYPIISKHFTAKEDYYISEAGLCLPSWQHSKLEKHRYIKQLPITMALSRQLGEFNIHANAQAFNRIWDKLREQADYYIWTERCKVKFGIVVQQLIIYSRAESALQHIQPYETRRNLLGLKNKEDLIRAVQHNARYGYIERLNIIYKYPKNSKYNTRDFYIKLYGKEPPKIQNKK